ncbi:hypothetical protein Tco_1083718 [Tanacetum coccineum]
MAAAGAGNEVARRVTDDLIDFSRETTVPKYMKFFVAQQIAKGRRFINRMREEAQTSKNLIAQLNALIAELEALEDLGEVYDMLMCLKDDKVVENNKLTGLNDLITYVEEDSEAKEAHVEIMEGESNSGSCRRLVIESSACYAHFIDLYGYATGVVFVAVSAFCILRISYHTYISGLLVLFGIHEAFFILDKLTEVVESSRLPDKMKYVFVRARSEDESFAGLMRNLCFSLRISLSKKRRLVSELEVLAERGDVGKSLEHMREIVARDAATLGDLEKLLDRTQVGVSLKDGYVANMEEKE